MMDNIVAVIIFIIAIAGVIALVVYKMRKGNNEVSIESFLDIYYQNLFGVIQDVVSLLSINVEDFETKEEYERVIISTTIVKLEENCEEFGISSALFKLVDKEVLTNVLYDILYTNKVQIFFSTLTEKIIKSKPELYDDEVIEAFENAEPALNEENDTHTESQEEPKHEEEIVEQEETIVDAPNNEEITEIGEEDTCEVIESANNEDNSLSSIHTEDTTNEENEIEDIANIGIEAEILPKNETIDNEPVEDVVHTEEPTYTVETAEQLANLAELPNADVDSAEYSIRSALAREHIDRD